MVINVLEVCWSNIHYSYYCRSNVTDQHISHITQTYQSVLPCVDPTQAWPHFLCSASVLSGWSPCCYVLKARAATHLRYPPHPIMQTLFFLSFLPSSWARQPVLKSLLPDTQPCPTIWGRQPSQINKKLAKKTVPLCPSLGLNTIR